ncbi:MAG: SDR family oxidoreductase [Chloroflexota bacterium]|nr:SDR family oxidoreductase [Chloroflexota bacterium]
MGRLDGTVVAITGGASGIGRATAERVLAEGGRVALIDLDADAAREAASALDTSGADVRGYACDVSDARATACALEAACRDLGRLDGLVTSAGVRQAPVAAVDIALDAWNDILRIDLGGTFVACQAAARIFVAQKTAASIVTVASISARAPRLGQAAYAAAKAGVVALTKALALELAAHGIRVNCVSPGTTLTPFNREPLTRDDGRLLRVRVEGDTSQFRPGIPLRRAAEASDVASSIAFLLSEDARHLTGVDLLVDGGETII